VKQLRDIETNLGIVKEFPELAGLPVIIGESDPEGCAACSARVHPQNAYRNGPLYGVYVVESMMRTYELSAGAGIEIEGAVTWAFLFDGQPYFDGFRELATNGIDKPVLNAFRMLGKLRGEWLQSDSSHRRGIDDILGHGVRSEPDVNVAATRDDEGVSVLLWHYHDDDVAGPNADIRLSIEGWRRGPMSFAHYRMDKDHSNAFAVWQAMGRPQHPEGADYDRLEAAGRLARIGEGARIDVDDGSVSLSVTLPRQGVSLVRLDW
jgi:xylan 1,4-beta-xylosidase